MGKAKLDFCLVDRHPAVMKSGGVFKYTLLLSVFLSTSCSYSFFQKNTNLPAGATSADFPDYDRFNSSNPSSKKSPSEIIREATDLLEDIFLVQAQGDYKCIDPNTFQKFIEMFFKTEEGASPQLDYLCMFKRENEVDHELRWVLSDTKSGVWELLPPTGLVDVDMRVLKSISVNEMSSINMAIEGKRSTIYFSGFKFNLSKAAVEGTALAWVPEFFLRFDVDKIEVTDDGTYLVKLIVPLGFPIKFKGQFETTVSKGRVYLSF